MILESLTLPAELHKESDPPWLALFYYTQKSDYIPIKGNPPADAVIFQVCISLKSFCTSPSFSCPNYFINIYAC